MIAVITCGDSKRQGVHKAKDLYVGPFFKMCLKYAQSIMPNDKIYILSAKWGLLKLDQEIENYNVKMGDPGSVLVSTLIIQSQELGIKDEAIIGVAGARYVSIMKKVWSEGKYPLTGLSLGYAMGALKKNMGRLP